MEWDGAISCKLRGLRGCYGFFSAVTVYTSRSFSRKSHCLALIMPWSHPLREAASYEPRIAILGIWSDAWLTRGKYGLYVAIHGSYGALTGSTWRLLEILPRKINTFYILSCLLYVTVTRIPSLVLRNTPGGGGGHSNYFSTGVCLTKPWNGGLKSWLQAQNIGSLELHKPWNRNLGGLRSGLKPQNTWTLELPKTYGNPLFWILFWIWGCKARLELLLIRSED